MRKGGLFRVVQAAGEYGLIVLSEKFNTYTGKTMRNVSKEISMLSVVLALLLTAKTSIAQTTECAQSIKTFNTDMGMLNYFDCGSGEPIVLVHGSLGSMNGFDGQLERLTQDFRVISYSRRYHPPNEPPQEGDVYSMQQHIDDLVHLIEELEVAPVRLVGHSFGAYISLTLAVQHPHLVRSLVLAEPPVLPLLSRTAIGQATLESFQRGVLIPSKQAFEQGDTQEGLKIFIDGISHPGFFDSVPEDVRKSLIQYIGPEFRLEMLTEPDVYMIPLTCEALEDLEIPTLLMTGEMTKIAFVLLITVELERCLEGESYVMVPEADHGALSGNAVFFNDTYVSFLKEN